MGEEDMRACGGDWLPLSMAKGPIVNSSGSCVRVDEFDLAFFVSRFGLESNQRVDVVASASDMLTAIGLLVTALAGYGDFRRRRVGHGIEASASESRADWLVIELLRLRPNSLNPLRGRRSFLSLIDSAPDPAPDGSATGGMEGSVVCTADIAGAAAGAETNSPNSVMECAGEGSCISITGEGRSSSLN